MALRKLAATLFAAAAITTSTVGLNGTAAAHTDSANGGTGIFTSEARGDARGRSFPPHPGSLRVQLPVFPLRRADTRRFTHP